MQTHGCTQKKHLCFLSLTLPLFLYFEEAPDSFYLFVSVRMLFVHQTNHLLKLCVFLCTPSPWHTASRGGALPIIWCIGMPSVGHCPLHRHEVRVFTPGSLSACCWIMGRARGSALFSAPNHSFGELISFSLWPAIIYSPVYFMAHFRFSTSLYVQANLHLLQCLYYVISLAPLCSVPCKTIRLELWAVVITLIPRCFIV